MNTATMTEPDLAATFQDAVEQHLAGRFDVAGQLYNKVLSQHPDHADSIKNLGAIALAVGEPDKAIELLTRAISINPNDPQSYNNLGVAYTNKRQHARAFACYRHATAIDSEFAQAWNNVGTSLRRTNEPREAEWAFRRAIAVNQDYVEALVNLGNILRERGEKREAKDMLERAVRLGPKNIAANCVLFELCGSDVGAPLFQTLTGFREQELHLGDAGLLEATIGRAHEKAGEYDAAFKCFHASNEIKKRSRAAVEPLSDLLRWIDEPLTLDRPFFSDRASWGSDSDTPVFVVGMPRSGTTLCEQIIASHPDAIGVGELHLIEECSRSVLRAGRGPTGLNSFERLVKRSDPYHIATLAQTYLDTLYRHTYPANALRIVDKNPFNFRYLWLIALMFPKSTIIHCRRDPRDSCLSSYCHLQGSFLNDLKDLGQYYISYDRLMTHWQNVLPLRVLDLHYEDLVNEPSGRIPELIEFCGLPWDEKCLRFYEGRQSIQTPSAEQVRRSIYTSSVGRWKNYEAHLEPLLDCLNGTPDLN